MITKIISYFKKKLDRKFFSLFLKKIDDLSLTDLDARRRNYTFNYNSNDYRADKNDLIFIHIPKTGGASIDEYLRNNAKNYYYFKKKSSHNAVSLLCPPEEYNYITFLREPTSRVFSYYNMCFQHKVTPSHSLAKKGIINLLKYDHHVRNLYCQYFSGYPGEIINEEIYNIALKNLKNFFFVGKFEKFSESFNEMCLLLKIDSNERPFVNTSEYKKISIDEKKLIEAYNIYDIKLYNEFFTTTKNNKN